MQPADNLEIVILAAGESRRFQGIKALQPIDRRPLLQLAIDKFSRLPGTSLSVILGAHREAIEKAIDFSGIEVRVNGEWEEGMSSSIRRAVADAGNGTEGLLFVAVDQVMLTTAHLDALIRDWRRQPDRIIAAGYRGKAGIPAIFPRRFWPELQTLRGDRGARGLLRDYGKEVITRPLPEAAVDIDTREDLARIVDSPPAAPE